MPEHQSQPDRSSTEFKIAGFMPVISGLLLVGALFMPWFSFLGHSISGFGLILELGKLGKPEAWILAIPAGIGVSAILVTAARQAPLVYGIPGAGVFLVLGYGYFAASSSVQEMGISVTLLEALLEEPLAAFRQIAFFGTGISITLLSLLALTALGFILRTPGNQRQSGSGAASMEPRNSFGLKKPETPESDQETSATIDLLKTGRLQTTESGYFKPTVAEMLQSIRPGPQDEEKVEEAGRSPALSGKPEEERFSGDNLEHLRKKKTGQYLKTVGIAAVVVVAVLSVLFYGRMDFLSPDPVSDSAQDNQPENGLGFVPEAARDSQSENLLQEEFREKMNFHENEVKPQIALLNLPGWAPEEQSGLESRENSAIEDFAGGNFASAIRKMNGLFDKVSELKKTQEENFRSAFEEARKAFESSRSAQALAAVNRSLLHKPDDSGAVKLQGRIAVMEELASIVKTADIAQVEGRLEDEIAAVARAVDLDPERADLAARRRLLVQQKRHRDFDAFVERSWTALNNKDLEQAKASLGRAARIFPDRRELVLLSEEVKQAEMDIAYRGFMKKAQAAAGHDDWPGAEAYYTKALQIFRGDGESRTGFDRARFINQQTEKLEKALSRPERLADEAIADATADMVEKSKKAAGRSPKLQQLIVRLSGLIEQASIPVSVVVRSDNKTDVSILGVGRIGKVHEYSLKEGLRPGKYTFKGKRRGFKDKLVQVQVRHGVAASVTVICDESV